MLPQTTVIISTYSRAALIAETITAVLDQSRPVLEILVVNDGSRDNTSRVVSEFGGVVTLIEKKNTGKSDSLNLALTRANGERVWIVDDDDLPCRDAHDILAGMLDAHPDADFAFGRHDRFICKQPGGAKIFLGTGYWGDDDPDRFFVSTLEDFFVHQPGMIARRTIYDAVGQFDPSLPASVDYDMLIRLARVGCSVSTSRIVFCQRIHDGLRGRKGEEYAASEREATWIRTDQMIFTGVRKTLSLREYLPLSQRERYQEGNLEHRAALIQRATVFARRKMWNFAIEDLFAASVILPDSPLSAEEKATLGRATLGKYGCNELFGDPAIVTGLKRLRDSSLFGKAIVGVINRSLIRRIRQGVRRRNPRSVFDFSKAHLALRIG